MLLGQVAETKAGQAAEPVRLTGYEPVSDRAAQHWKAAYAYVRGDILARPEAAAQPLLTANAEGLLAAVTLATFPSNALAEPTAEDRHDAHPAALRRTIAFIDQHAHQDISIADIAAAANVTARAVCSWRSAAIWTPRPWATCAGSGSTGPTASCSPVTEIAKPSPPSPTGGDSLARPGSPSSTAPSTALRQPHPPRLTLMARRK